MTGATKHASGYLFTGLPFDTPPLPNPVDNPEDYCYKYLIGGKNSKQIAQFDANGKFIRLHDDAKKAAKSVGLKDNANIIRAKTSRDKLVKGFKWRGVTQEMYNYHLEHKTIPIEMANEGLK